MSCKIGNGMLSYKSLLRRNQQFASGLWPRGQAVKTSPFHGGNTGSIPVGVIVSPCKSGETLLTAAIWIARKRPKDGR